MIHKASPSSITANRYRLGLWKRILYWIFPTYSYSVSLPNGAMIQRLKLINGQLIVYDTIELSLGDSVASQDFVRKLLEDLEDLKPIVPGGNS